MATRDGSGRGGDVHPGDHRFDRDLLEVIETGDWPKVDAEAGIVEVTRKEAGAAE